MDESESAYVQQRIRTRSVKKESLFDDVQLPPLPDIPAQITHAEERYLYWLIHRGYTGAGAIVEVGTWLGRSTVHLAAGLRDSGIAGQFTCYDHYVWRGPELNRKSGLNLEQGADFRPYFEEYIEPLKDYVTSITADFSQITWSGEPIEILFLDGPKTARQFSEVLAPFCEYLIPDKAIVVCQDYLHPPSYQLALALHVLRNKLSPLHVVLDGGTVSFQLNGSLSKEEVEFSRLRYIPKDKEAAVSVWDEILDSMPEASRRRLAAGKAMNLCDVGEVELACRVFNELEFDERMNYVWTAWSQMPYLAKQYQPLFELFRERHEVSPPS